MADFGNTSVFSQTDDSNTNIGTGPGFTGTMPPNGFDNNMRKLQGAAFREWNWRLPTITTAGTSTALTMTYSVAPAAYYNGQEFSALLGTAIDDGATLNINSLGAKAIKRFVGGSLVAITPKFYLTGDLLRVVYNTAADCFIATNVSQWSQALVKPSDTTIASNITPASDATLTFAMAANTNYRIRGELFVYSSGGGGFRAGITGPTSPTIVRLGSVWANDISNTAGGFNITSYAQFHNALPAGSTNMHFTITCDLQNGANAGTFALQFAQNTSNVNGCVIRKGSYIEYRTY